MILYSVIQFSFSTCLNLVVYQFPMFHAFMFSLYQLVFPSHILSKFKVLIAYFSCATLSHNIGSDARHPDRTQYGHASHQQQHLVSPHHPRTSYYYFPSVFSSIQFQTVGVIGDLSQQLIMIQRLYSCFQLIEYFKQFQLILDIDFIIITISSFQFSIPLSTLLILQYSQCHVRPWVSLVGSLVTLSTVLQLGGVSGRDMRSPFTTFVSTAPFDSRSFPPPNPKLHMLYPAHF